MEWDDRGLTAGLPGIVNVLATLDVACFPGVVDIFVTLNVCKLAYQYTRKWNE